MSKVKLIWASEQPKLGSARDAGVVQVQATRNQLPWLVPRFFHRGLSSAWFQKEGTRGLVDLSAS